MVLKVVGTVAGGTLALSNKAAATPNYVDPTSSMVVNGGGILEIHTNGAIGAFGDAPVTLGGGVLKVVPTWTPSATPGLLRNRYDDYDGGAFPYSRWAELETAIPNESIQDLVINDEPGLDGYTMTWRGSLFIPTTGTYRFNFGSDDEGRLQIDTGFDGFDETIDTIGTTNNSWSSGQRVLIGGLYYPFRFGFAEGGGGDWGRVQWDGGTGGAYEYIDDVNDPLAAVNFFTGGILASALNNDLIVTASSTLETSSSTDLGQLSLVGSVAGTTLAVTGPAGTSLTFDSTTVDGTAGNVGIANADVTVKTSGQLDDNDIPVTLTKSGAADLIADQTALPNNFNDVTIDVQGGRIVGVGEDGGNDPLGGATVRLTGGDMAVSSKGGNVSIAGDLDVQADGQLQVGQHGGGTATDAVVTMTGDVGVSLGTLTITRSDGYGTNLAGTSSGGGGLTFANGRHEVSGSVANLGAITLEGAVNDTNSAQVNVTNAAGMGAGNTVVIQPNAHLNMDAVTPTMPGSTTVQATGILGGDLTNAVYDVTGAPNVTLDGNAIIAYTAGADPARGDLATGLVYRGVTDLGSAITNLGDDGASTVYKGVAFDTRYAMSHLGAGLLEGRLAGGFNRTDANPGGATTLDVRAAQTNATPPWGDQETWVYTGQFYDADGAVSFGENIDDNAWLKIDGNVLLNDTNWSTVTQTNILALGMGAMGDGWHDFELRVGNGTGGAGGVWAGGVGFLWSITGRTDAGPGVGDWAKPVDSGTMDMFRTMSYDFTGTLAEAAGASGFEVRMNGPLAFVGATVDATGTVDITNIGNFSIKNGWLAPASTATDFVREGIMATQVDPGTTGQTILTLGGTNALTAGMTMEARYGTVRYGGDSVEAGATLYIGDQAVAWNVPQATTGAVEILRGGALQVGHGGNDTNSSVGVTWNHGSTVIVGKNQMGWTDEGLPTDVAMSVAYGRWPNDDGRMNQGLYLGTGQRLYGTHTWEWARIYCDNWGQAAINGVVDPDNPDAPIIISGPAAREGNGTNREFRIYKLDMPLAGFDIQINDPPGTTPLLYAGNEWEEAGMTLLPRVNNGIVRFWGNVHTADTVSIEAGTLDLGSHEGGEEGDVSIYNFERINVRTGTTLEVSEQYELQRSYQAHDTRIGEGINPLASDGIYVDDGGSLISVTYRMNPDGIDGTHILTPIIFTGDGTGTARFRADDERDAGGTRNRYFYDNIKLMDGAEVVVQNWDTNREELRLSVELDGLSYMRRWGDEWTFQDITGDGEVRVGWTPALGGWGGDIDLRGTIGGTDSSKLATLTILTGGTFRPRPGFAMTDNGRIDFVAVPGLPGQGDSYIEWRTGRAVDDAGTWRFYDEDFPTPIEFLPVMAGEIRIGDENPTGIGGAQDMTVRVSDGAGGPDAAFAGPTFKIGAKMSPVNGFSWWQAGRDDWLGPDTSNQGTVYFTDETGGGFHLTPDNFPVLESGDNTFNVADFTLNGDPTDTFRIFRNDWWRARLHNISGDADGDIERLKFDHYSGEDPGNEWWYTGRTFFTGKLTNVAIDWNIREILTIGPGFDLNGCTVNILNERGGVDVGLWQINGEPQHLQVDPGDGIINMVQGPVNTNPNTGDSRMDIRSGSGGGGDLWGEAGWGDGTTINLSGMARLNLGTYRVNDPDTNTNVFNGRVNILNDEMQVREWDGRLLAWNLGGGDGGAEWRSTARFTDVHIAPGAKLLLQRDNILEVDLKVDDSGGMVGVQDGDRTYIRNVTGNAGLGGLETLEIVNGPWGGRRTYLRGTV
ncbi:MAG TPA: PA14 domain-containing protein, partial [Phycisphaerae bacterium]|nr:PA14 domain-containing protein [Phycisphaerae bacterium]